MDEFAVGVVDVIKSVFRFAAQVFFHANQFAVLEIADVGGCAAAVHALLELGLADFIIQFGGALVFGECHAGEIVCAVDGLFRLPEAGVGGVEWGLSFSEARKFGFRLPL